LVDEAISFISCNAYKMERGGSVYIITNRYNKVPYTGVNNDLYSRVTDHKDKIDPNSFPSWYNVDKLVYFENFDSIEEAIAREKQLKAGSRQKKIDLINSMNPNWDDLLEEVKKW